jgi:hypothetical protein
LLTIQVPDAGACAGPDPCNPVAISGGWRGKDLAVSHRFPAKDGYARM